MRAAMIEHIYIENDILGMEISLPAKIILALVKSFDPEPLAVGNEELMRICSYKDSGSISDALNELEDKNLVTINNRQSKYRKILLSEKAKVKTSTMEKTESYFVKNPEVTLLKSQTELNRTKSNYIFVLKNKKDWPLTQAKYDEYKSTFSDVDLDTELKKMIQWLRDNPAKRKTASGMTRFINSWLSRAKPDEAKLQQKKLDEYSQKLIDEHPTTSEEARELMKGIV
jgi:hypothetical protein